jgi:hypothetical protein
MSPGLRIGVELMVGVDSWFRGVIAAQMVAYLERGAMDP